MPSPALAIVLKGYPRLSETFIAQEILNIERSGIDTLIVSLRHPTDKDSHPVHKEIKAGVNYLPEYLYREPLRVLRSWRAARVHPGFKASRRQFIADLLRDRSANRIRRFGQAMVLAAELPAEVSALYAHFLHTPASVTRYAALILDLPWACSAHAKDIYTSPDWEITGKLNHMAWLTTCTRTNVEHLSSLAGNPDDVYLNYHGLDLSRFDTAIEPYSGRDGSNPEQPVRLLSVGRAVAKKGYGQLLASLATLPTHLYWRLQHIGGGALIHELKDQAIELGIADRITWSGAQPQEEVLDAYRQADLFVLNSRIDDNGDRDGLPNVLVEAQSQGVVVLSTRISGIPELINEGENGLLVDSGDQQALGAALAKLIQFPGLRQEMGQNGQRRVREQFEMGASFLPLLERIRNLIAR